jgi:hypothetical protein
LSTPFDDPDSWPADLSCVACDLFGPVNDLGLCSGCAAKLDRDMIRQRAWDYSTSAFTLPPGERETLRKAVLRKFGKALELVPPETDRRTRRRR